MIAHVLDMSAAILDGLFKLIIPELSIILPLFSHIIPYYIIIFSHIVPYDSIFFPYSPTNWVTSRYDLPAVGPGVVSTAGGSSLIPAGIEQPGPQRFPEMFRIFHYKPSMLGYLHLWKPPNIMCIISFPLNK